MITNSSLHTTPGNLNENVVGLTSDVSYGAHGKKYVYVYRYMISYTTTNYYSNTIFNLNTKAFQKN